MDKKFYRKTKYFDYSLFLLVFPIFINGCERKGITTDSKNNHSINMTQSIEQPNFKEVLVMKNNNNTINKSIQTNDNFTEIVLTRASDLDANGENDTISVEKPKSQDDRNFDLKISVYRMINGKSHLWQQNVLMFKDPINGCMMDGLEDITTSLGKFTIEYTSCYDNQYARRFVSFLYDPQSNDFKVNKNTISFLEPESDELSQTFGCKDNNYLFSSYDDSCEWL